jgi:hypothetical protein
MDAMVKTATILPEDYEREPSGAAVVLQSRPTSFGDQVMRAFMEAAQKAIGGKPQFLPFAVRKNLWIHLCGEALEEGDIDPLQFLMMTSALTGRHEDSGFNRLEYVSNVIRIYNSRFQTEEVKQNIFQQDIIDGSDGRISQKDLSQVLAHARHIPTTKRSGMREEFCYTNGVQQTFSAISKDQLFPIMSSLCQERLISFEQVALVLSINLHSRERRRSGGRYLDHPMAVAGMVLSEGQLYFDTEHDLAVAIAAALMHDTGEKSNYDPERDYVHLMPTEVVQCIVRLHKKDSQSYFDYIRNCACDERSAFVKYCDLRHNCSDATLEKSSFKQKYIYPIAAAYMKAVLENPSVSDMSVKEFVVQNGICDATTFDAIDCISNGGKKGYDAQQSEEIENLLKLDTLALSKFVTFDHLPSCCVLETPEYAYPR